MNTSKEEIMFTLLSGESRDFQGVKITLISAGTKRTMDKMSALVASLLLSNGKEETQLHMNTVGQDTDEWNGLVIHLLDGDNGKVDLKIEKK